MRRVFICSPYRGDVSANVAFAMQICREVALAGDAPFAPHLLFPRWLDDEVPAEREAGITAGLAWLEVADELLVAGTVTDGMRREIEAASELGIPITFRPRSAS